jgi:hypothetical protein
MQRAPLFWFFVRTILARKVVNRDVFNEIWQKMFSFNIPVNKCRPNPCQNAAKCVIDLKRMDGYRCMCTSDFTGRHCQGERGILWCMVVWPYMQFFYGNFLDTSGPATSYVNKELLDSNNSSSVFRFQFRSQMRSHLSLKRPPYFVQIRIPRKK